MPIDRRAWLLAFSAFALFLAIALWSLAKGAVPRFHLDELYFWFAAYRDGYARRSFIGTIVQWAMLPSSPDRTHLVAAFIYIAAGLVSLVFVAGAAYRVSLVCAACTELSGSFLGWYNRDLARGERDALVHDPAFGN